MQEKAPCVGEKKPYAKPELKIHGSVSELTQHGRGRDDRGNGNDRGGPGSHLGW